MRTLIIDNEPSIAQGLQTMLKLYCPELELVGKAESMQEGVRLIQASNPALIFLDVELGDGTGFDLLDKIPERNFQIIFITAFDHYALRAIKVSALDFLLKPIDPQELSAAVAKAQKNNNHANIQDQISVLLAEISEQKNQKLVLTDADSIYLVETHDIVHIQADGSYSRFFLQDGQEILVSKHLKFYEKLLDGSTFFRVHHAHLVNLTFVKRLDKSEGGFLVLKNDQQIPISSRRRATLIKLITSM